MLAVLERTAALALITICCIHFDAVAEPTATEPLTRERVIELARKRAPVVLTAQTRVAEARGKLVGARVLIPENPVLELMTGPRWADTRSTDAEAQLAVPIALGGRRDKRIAVATAGVDRDTQLAYDTQRTAIGAALVAYYHSVYAKARIDLAQARTTLADDL